MLAHCQEIVRRPAGPADDGFLRALFAEGRDDLVLLPTDVRDTLLDMQFRARRRQHAADHPQATHEILAVDGTDVGVLVLDQDSERVHVVDLVVAHAHRRRGIATGALRDVTAEAGSREVTIAHRRVASHRTASRDYP